MLDGLVHTRQLVSQHGYSGAVLHASSALGHALYPQCVCGADPVCGPAPCHASGLDEFDTPELRKNILGVEGKTKAEEKLLVFFWFSELLKKKRESNQETLMT